MISKLKKNRILIYITGFLFSIPLALTSYINSSYLEQYIDKDYVGLIYVLTSTITIISMTTMPKILTKVGSRKATLIFILGFLVSLLLMAYGSNIAIVLTSFTAYFLSLNLIVASLDIFMEDFSKGDHIGKLRGTYILASSLAWVFAQIIFGSIIDKNGFFGVYLFSSLFMLLVSFMFIFFFKDFKDPEYRKVSMRNTLRSFWGNKDLLRIYFINLILRFFFAWMTIYTPIYLHENIGLQWDQIGIIFSFMLLPFVILTLPLGNLSDKIGEKKMLSTGFIIAVIFVFLIPFVNTSIIWIWAALLFMTRVGASTIQIMSESYFFKVAHEEEADEISFFRNTGPMSYIIAPALATPILLLIPSFEYIFFILSSILLIGLYFTLNLKDVK